MPIVQFTMDFSMRGYGWSETWYKNSELASLKAFDSQVGTPFVLKRNAMLGFQATLDARTTSYVDTKGDSYLVYTGLTAGGLGPEIPASSPHEAIYTLIRADDDKKRRGTWLRGIADAVVDDGGLFKPGYTPWVQPATVFMDAVIQGEWGWMSLVPVVPKYSITNYAEDADGYVDFTFAGNPFAGVEEGSPKKIRILFKGVKSKLNGYQTVIVTGPNSAQSLTPIAVFPFVRPGKATLYTPTFYAAQNYSFQKAGERRAGRPKLHTRGHAPAAPKG